MCGITRGNNPTTHIDRYNMHMHFSNALDYVQLYAQRYVRTFIIISTIIMRDNMPAAFP